MTFWLRSMSEHYLDTEKELAVAERSRSDISAKQPTSSYQKQVQYTYYY